MANLDLTYIEAWDLIFLLKSIVADSEYNEAVDLYVLKENAPIVHNLNDWKRLQTIIDKLVDTYHINITIG